LCSKYFLIENLLWRPLPDFLVAKLLFTTLPSNDLGLLTRSLPIASELHKRGHEIVFCSPAQAPSRLIADAGFSNLPPLDPFYTLITGDFRLTSFVRLLRAPRPGHHIKLLAAFLRHMFRVSTAEIWNIDHFMNLFGAWNDEFVQANVKGLVDIINRSQPEAIVDFWNPFACIAARVTRKPLVAIIQADMHPLSQGFIWWKDAPPNLPTSVPALNRVLTTLKLPPIEKAGEILLGNVTLVLGIPETDPLPGIDATYIGPILWEKKDEKLPVWVAGLSTEQPVIWVYSGNPRYAPGINTAFDSGVVLSAVLEALKNEPVQVVLTTGHHRLPGKFLPLPRNFHFTPYIPGLAMAGRSDLLIHHGGYGSCQTGLFTGTPALILPTYSERESNARRVAAVGAGEFHVPDTDASGRKKHLDPDTLRASVRQILSMPSYKENAMQIREKLRSYGGAAAAAQFIEKFLQDRNNEEL
jgi:UDP:flavonoid glycosyltransferase YjiC (YdhE family)